MGEIDHLIARLRHSRATWTSPAALQGCWAPRSMSYLPWRPRQRNDVFRVSDPIPAVRESTRLDSRAIACRPQYVPGAPSGVAHVIQNLNYGGMERVLHNLARELPPMGFEVHIVVLQYLGHFAEGLEGRHLSPGAADVTALLFHPVKLINAVSQQSHPDVVHSHTGVWLKASRAARVGRAFRWWFIPSMDARTRSRSPTG